MKNMAFWTNELLLLLFRTGIMVFQTNPLLSLLFRTSIMAFWTNPLMLLLFRTGIMAFRTNPSRKSNFQENVRCWCWSYQLSADCKCIEFVPSDTSSYWNLAEFQVHAFLDSIISSSLVSSTKNPLFQWNNCPNCNFECTPIKKEEP